MARRIKEIFTKYSVTFCYFFFAFAFLTFISLFLSIKENIGVIEWIVKYKEYLLFGGLTLLFVYFGLLAFNTSMSKGYKL